MAGTGGRGHLQHGGVDAGVLQQLLKMADLIV